MLGTLADRLAGDDKNTAVATGMTMAAVGMTEIAGMFTGGSELGGPVAGINQNQQRAAEIG